MQSTTTSDPSNTVSDRQTSFEYKTGSRIEAQRDYVEVTTTRTSMASRIGAQDEVLSKKAYAPGSTSETRQSALRNRSRSFSPSQDQGARLQPQPEPSRYPDYQQRRSPSPSVVDPALQQQETHASQHQRTNGSLARPSAAETRLQGSNVGKPYLSNVSSACAVWETQIQEHEKTHSSTLRHSSSGRSPLCADVAPSRPDDPGESGVKADKVPSPSYTFPPNPPPDLKRTTSNTQSVSFSQTSSSVALSHTAAHRELTSKGKKRKRLAKACSACHKNKRRCDGFAPCSNCEFSSRRCVYLNAKGEVIPPPKTREGSVSGISGAVLYDMETSDTHSISHKLTERSSVAGLATPRSERSHRPLDVDTFKRPLPPASFGGHSDARSRDLRRESQGTMSSVYSERPAPLVVPAPPLPVNPAVASLEFAHRQSDLPRRESLIDEIAEPAAGPSGGLYTTTNRRPSRPSLSYPLQPRSSLLQAAGRTGSLENLSLNAKLRAVERQAAFVEELIHAFFARLHPYQLMFHQPTFQYRRYLNLVPLPLLYMMYALAIRFIDPVTLHDALVAEHATPSEIDLPLFLAGEVFVDEAKQAIQTWLKQKSASMRRASWSTSSLQTWEDLEMTMAVTLCGFYEKAMTRMSDAAQHFGMSCLTSLCLDVSEVPNDRLF